MTTSLANRVLAVLSDGGLTAQEIAAKLWPDWRTQRGHLTAAAEGTARRALKQLEAAQRVKQAEETRAGRTVFVSVPCSVDSPA